MAFCPRCAAPNIDTAVACAACGAPLSAAPGAPVPPIAGLGPGPATPSFDASLAPRTNGLAIAGFVTSILCGVVGLILSIVAYNQCKKSNGQLKGEGLAIAGIIIGGVNIVLGIILRAAAH